MQTSGYGITKPSSDSLLSLIFPVFESLSLYLSAGLMATYHAKNEYCLLTDMCQGFDVFVRIISQLEQD